MQNAEVRERMFTMRLSDEESTRLDGIAAHYGLNAAGLIRMLLKREEDALAATAQRHARLFFNTDRDRVTQAAIVSGVLAVRPDDQRMLFDVMQGENGPKIGTFTAEQAIDVIARWPGSQFAGFDEGGKLLPLSRKPKSKK